MKRKLSELIRQRRRQCLVHRIIYYCFDENIVSDRKYDRWERQLKKLCKEFPKVAKRVEYANICPSKKVGSSNINSYPLELVRVAQWLLAYHKKLKKDKEIEKRLNEIINGEDG